MGFRQILVVGALALAQVRHGVEPESVNAGIEPALHHLQHRADHARVVEVQVRLVREKAVPVIGASLVVPGPVRLLRVGEDDTGAGVLLVVVAPDVPVARARSGAAALGALEPGMLVGGVVDHELGDDTQAPPLGFVHEAAEVAHVAELRVDIAVVGNVIAVVAPGAGIEGQQPQGGDAEVAQIVEPLGQAGEVADAVMVRVLERLDVQLVDDGVLEPEAIGLGGLVFGLERGPDVHASPFCVFFKRGTGTAAPGRPADRCAAARRSIRADGARRSSGSRFRAPASGRPRGR